MSLKSSLKNGIGTQYINEPQWSLKTTGVETTVKLAGDEDKDRLYEPKHKKKLVRVLTVIAYVFFVSLAAIMLSLYYVFLWNGNQKPIPKYAVHRHCDSDAVAEMQQQYNDVNISPTISLDNHTMNLFEDFDDDEDSGRSVLIKRLMFDDYPYAEND